MVSSAFFCHRNTTGAGQGGGEEEEQEVNSIVFT
jgi:hypothetical protein